MTPEQRAEEEARANNGAPSGTVNQNATKGAGRGKPVSNADGGTVNPATYRSHDRTAGGFQASSQNGAKTGPYGKPFALRSEAERQERVASHHFLNPGAHAAGTAAVAAAKAKQQPAPQPQVAPAVAGSPQFDRSGSGARIAASRPATPPQSTVAAPPPQFDRSGSGARIAKPITQIAGQQPSPTPGAPPLSPVTKPAFAGTSGSPRYSNVPADPFTTRPGPSNPTFSKPAEVNAFQKAPAMANTSAAKGAVGVSRKLSDIATAVKKDLPTGRKPLTPGSGIAGARG